MSKTNSTISEKLSAGKPLLSVEFFPPKNEAGARQILRTANKLRSVNPDFVSITYGAGGTTRELTIEYADLIMDIFDYIVMPHLTCVGHSKDELREVLDRFYNIGVRNIMTLRGDPPKGSDTFEPHPDGLSYASELVSFIQKNYPDMCLGVAGYPEMHPEAPSMEEDLKNLKHKVDQGASFVTTQLFFDNKHYYDFVEKCRDIGINVPIIPGILPVISGSQLKRFCEMCGTSIPDELNKQIEDAGDDNDKVIEIGINWAFEQITDLFKNGAPGVHLYILNREYSGLTLMKKLRESRLLS